MGVGVDSREAVPCPRPGSPGGGMRQIRKRGNLMAQVASNPEPEAAGKLE